MTNQSSPTVSDSNSNNWVDNYAPVWARPYMHLARYDRPIGTWLLLIPCWWSLALVLVADPQPGASMTWLFILFAIGAIAMRGAGCTFNDIVDRKYDARVARTRSRPLASGQISLKSAILFLGAQCLVGLMVLIQFNNFAILFGISSLGLVAIYPFMKRITYWPQAVLGLTFNWGAMLGWVAVTGSLNPAPLLLYAAAICWTIGYDTIYAHQDKDDDALLGLKSTALKFGDNTQMWLGLFYGLAIVLLGLAGLSAGAGSVFYVGLLVGSAHLGWQIQTLNIDDSAICLRLFRSNRNFGFIILIALLAEQAINI
jgi:4-hydroxybenzoate polyprenyltransferase